MTSHIHALVIVAAVSACAQSDDQEDADTAHGAPAPGTVPSAAEIAPLLVPPAFECKGVRTDDIKPPEELALPKPPFSPKIFPCTRCHDKPTDFNTTTRNLLAEHLQIKLVHGSREQWCYDCHNPPNRDMLRLAGGRLVPYEHSYELCGQCHGEKLRDWRRGIHGRRSGCWNGPRQYLLCVNCHNPHAPAFKPMSPLPRPKRPAEIRLEHRSEP